MRAKKKRSKGRESDRAPETDPTLALPEEPEPLWSAADQATSRILWVTGRPLSHLKRFEVPVRVSRQLAIARYVPAGSGPLLPPKASPVAG
jgi:hypothetical protein